MAATDIRKIFEDMPAHFKTGALEEELSFYFSLGDEKWTVTVGPKKCSVKEGKTIENADCVLKTSPEFFRRMVLEGYVPGMLDFTTGKVKSNDPFKLKALKDAFQW